MYTHTKNMYINIKKQYITLDTSLVFTHQNPYTRSPRVICIMLYMFYYNARYPQHKNITIAQSHYTVKYTFGYTNYKIRLPRRRGPPKCLPVITDEQGQDITREIIEYMGPNMDFHGQSYTPTILGKSKIIIKNNEKKKIFNKTDILYV